jgi:LPS-assembly protein
MARLSWLVLSGLILAALPGPTKADNRNEPVAFTADDVQYDREGGIVTATGHVEAWQNGRSLSADKIVFDRDTGVAAASGHVVMTSPDGQVSFADYAELSDDMKDGVLTGMRAILTKNGRLAANAARRTNGTINELSRAIYSTCNLCAEDPTSPPLWDIRAREAVQDTEHKQIEYRDVVVDIYGVPVFYTPYLSHPDPTQKRASGLLVPDFGYSSRHLGTYLEAPYYLVLDESSDLMLTPELTGKADQALKADYRLRLNDGTIRTRASVSDEFGRAQGHLFTKGDFTLDDVWRWGFDINRVSGAIYARNYSIASIDQSMLTSTVFIEGFGQAAYSRTDVQFYQKLLTAATSGYIPAVLPRTQYSFLGEPDALGGRLAVDTGAFNVVRTEGTSTERVNLSLDYSRPLETGNGQRWTLGAHLDSAAYSAHGLGLTPTFSPYASANTSQAMPTAYAEWRWPFMRDAGEGWGTQIVEPIVKVMASPQGQSYLHTAIPNEDSLDVDFTDANLFAINRSPGIDRQEGGQRVAVALHGSWLLPDGEKFDGIVGQSYRTANDPYFAAASGLRGKVSDIVARQSFQPMPILDLTLRERFDHDTMQTRFADFTTAVGDDRFRLTAGYIYSNTSSFLYYDNLPGSAAAQAALTTPRNEASLGVSTHFGEWRFSGNVRQDLLLHRPVGIDAHASYENECAIFDVRFYRRYTSVLSDQGDTGLLFSITLKTVGEFGFHGG